MDKFVRKLLFFSALVAFTSSCHAASPSELYELQERCSRRAEELFIKNFAGGEIINTDDGKAFARYTNHFSNKLNKCFYLVTVANIPFDSSKESTTSITLYDVNQVREYGVKFTDGNSKSPSLCFVNGKDCHSDKEWSTLIRPYMEK